MAESRRRYLWIVPAVVLILLILVGTTRWETVASRYESHSVFQWQRDRWTGAVICVIYLPTKVRVSHLGYLAETQDNLTAVWQIALVVTLIWLILSLFKSLKAGRLSVKREQNLEKDPVTMEGFQG